MSLLGGTLLFRNFKVIIPVKPREEVVRERKVTCLAATHVRRGAHFACIKDLTSKRKTKALTIAIFMQALKFMINFPEN